MGDMIQFSNKWINNKAIDKSIISKLDDIDHEATDELVKKIKTLAFTLADKESGKTNSIPTPKHLHEAVFLLI